MITIVRNILSRIKKTFLRVRGIVLLLLFSFILAGAILLSLNIFRVHKIIITGTPSITGISNVNNQLIFLINTSKLENALLQENPYIGALTIEKKLPSTLMLTVLSTHITAQLKVADGWYVLSPTARILAKKRSKTKKLTTITYFTKYPFETYNVGDYVDQDEIMYATYFLDKLKSVKNIAIDQVAIDHLFVIVCRGSGHELWITTKKTKEQQFGQLRTILRQFSVTGKKFKKIDLRFSKPLVTLSTAE